MRSTKLLSLAAALGLITLGLAGCGDDTGTNVSADVIAASDEAAIGMIIAEDSENFGFGSELDESTVQVGQLDGKVSASGAPIESFFFMRRTRIVNRQVDIHINQSQGEPPIATVTVTHDLEGIFRLFYEDPAGIYLPATLDKPLVATSIRTAKFVKSEGERRHRDWRLIEVSGVEVESVPVSKLIERIEIRSASVDMVITDPSELWPLREVPWFGLNEEVTITLYTNDETDYVFLHTPGGKADFQPLGGGVFEGTWTTSMHEGRRRVAFDVIDVDTLFDDQAPYDSVIWGFPYRVADVGTSDPS